MVSETCPEGEDLELSLMSASSESRRVLIREGPSGSVVADTFAWLEGGARSSTERSSVMTLVGWGTTVGAV